jgi:enoyl-CoA hydratase/carnithine racemase
MNVAVCKAIKIAEEDNTVKVVLFHGGKFFSAGNDLAILTAGAGDEKEVQKARMVEGITSMKDTLMAWITCSKPVVAVVRGGAHGIGFTTLAHMDFIYCGPDAYFQTPFMKSFQSPEGGSMLTFP